MNATRIAPGRYRVQSERDPALSYSVETAGAGDCDCIGVVTHGPGTVCKHIKEARRLEAQMNENSTAVAIRNQDVIVPTYNPTFPTKSEVKSILFMAKNFAALSGKMIPASIKTPQEAFAVMIAGREWGLGPMESLREMYVVNGTTMPSYRVLAGAVLRGDPTASFKWLERSATKATAQLIREGRETLEITYTIEDAKRAGLADKDNWKKYPTDMLCAKVVTRLCRLGGADLITRISSSVRGAPAVMRAVEDDDDGEDFDALEGPQAQHAEEPDEPAPPPHPSTQPKPVHVNIRVQNAMQAAKEHLDEPTFAKLLDGLTKAYGDVLTPQFSVKVSAKLTDEQKQKIVDVATSLVAQTALADDDEPPADDAEQLPFE